MELFKLFPADASAEISWHGEQGGKLRAEELGAATVNVRTGQLSAALSQAEEEGGGGLRGSEGRLKREEEGRGRGVTFKDGDSAMLDAGTQKIATDARNGALDEREELLITVGGQERQRRRKRVRERGRTRCRDERPP